MTKDMVNIFGQQVLQFMQKHLPSILQQSVRDPVQDVVEEMYMKFSQLFSEGYSTASWFNLLYVYFCLEEKSIEVCNTNS